MKRSRFQTSAVLLTVLALGCNLQACPVCVAAPDSPETRGMTMAILFLLGVIGTVVCGVLSFFVYLAVRQKEPVPAHVALLANSGTINP